MVVTFIIELPDINTKCYIGGKHNADTNAVSPPSDDWLLQKPPNTKTRININQTQTIWSLVSLLLDEIEPTNGPNIETCITLVAGPSWCA